MREGALAHLEEVRKRLHKKSFEFNVVKLDARSCVSFLHYSEFETTPFPALREALSCDVFLGATRITVYSTRLNPPILHRKELLLPADHPLVPEATRLTEDLERLGAFEDPHQIGTRHGWTNRLASLGLMWWGAEPPSADEHRNTSSANRVAPGADVLPHAPFAAVRILDGTYKVFDYGCGRGDDLRLLEGMKVPASGWDPVYRPDGRREPADVVNLGFVLNVIEDAAERRDTLKEAFELARKVLVISVMLGYQREREQFAAFRDGVRTRRNTFQRYFTQEEFRSYVEATLVVNAVPVAAGICLVFRNPMDEQLFLAARQQVRREWRLVRREPHSEAVASLIAQHRDAMDTYWRQALELGRPPIAAECPAAVALAGLVGSWRRVHEWVSGFFDSEQLDAAAIGRQEDLLVYSRWVTSAVGGRTRRCRSG